MLKLRHRIGREHFHVLSKERRWVATQGRYPKVVNHHLKENNPLVHTSGIHSGSGTSIHLDQSSIHGPVQSFNKIMNGTIFRLWKQIPVKSILKRFSSYVDRFKLGWQEDNENVCCTECWLHADYKFTAFYRIVLTVKRK